MQDEVPLFGTAPAFPLEAYAEELGKALDIPDLKLACSDVQWREADALFSMLGDTPVLHAFQVPPLEGYAYWIFPKEELKLFMQSTVLPKEDSTNEWNQEWNEEWENEFYEYLSLQAIQALQKVKFDSALSPQLLADGIRPTAPCLCIDIDLATAGHTFQGRLAISPEMRISLKQKYTPTSLTYPAGLSEAVTTTLHVVIGSTHLKKAEWQAAEAGDFLLLDSCTLAPGDEKGRVVLTINNTPIFRAKIKDRSLKLLEYPLLQEVQTPMAKNPNDEFEDPFEMDDESISEETTDQKLDSEFEEDELTEETSDEHLEGFDEDAVEAPAKEKNAHPMQAAKDLLKKSTATALVKPEEIPLTISIEIARIQMSIHQLMQLAPGNMLDLDISPENGVDLVVNGHCIGKGELLKLGETLGVRILDKA
jgi:flagellar motor switch protein FliN/FliY